MRILVIDDLRNPNEALSVMGEIQIARNSTEAMNILKDNPSGFDAVFFDHDLGGEDTTRTIVTWLEREAILNDSPYPIKDVFVHTSNVTGGDWIIAALNPHYKVRRIASSVFFDA